MQAASKGECSPARPACRSCGRSTPLSQPEGCTPTATLRRWPPPLALQLEAKQGPITLPTRGARWRALQRQHPRHCGPAEAAAAAVAAVARVPLPPISQQQPRPPPSLLPCPCAT